LLLETFLQLLHSPGHWEFEFFGLVMVDGLAGAIVWPFIKRHIHKDRDKEHAHEKVLEARIAALEEERHAHLGYDVVPVAGKALTARREDNVHTHGVAADGVPWRILDVSGGRPPRRGSGWGTYHD
jgi:hypothetical protein